MKSYVNLSRSIALLSSAALIASLPAAANAKRTVVRTKTTTSTVVRVSRPPVGVQRPAGTVYLSTGRGQLVTLPAAISDIFVSQDTVADVRVQSPTQLYLFGKTDGETSIFATNRAGQVVYSTNVRVGQNFNSVDDMLHLAMPDTDAKVTTSGNIAVLTGTVNSPDDIAQAESLVKSMLPGINVVNRLKTATPLQVMLQVRIAEVSRTFSKTLGVNWANRDSSNGGPVFGIAQGRVPGTISGTNPTTFSFNNGTAFSTLSLGARFLGMDILGALDAGETEGFVTTLATPNLTALSGETANFVVGGEIPIPIAQVTGGGTTTSVEYKTYGIKLDFSPTVIADGRISLRVQPEVSELDYVNAVKIAGTDIPGLTTRRVQTTVELGSGQSFVIGGLLRSNNSNTVQKVPGVGDIPIIGALARSNTFKRGESELMIVVTPYLVNPVPASKIVLPTDGYKTPTELGRIFMGDMYKGATESRPVPTTAPSQTIARPAFGASLQAQPAKKAAGGTSAAPGFSK